MLPAQSPLAGWERPSRRFAANGADPPPRWSDFADPLDAISGRFGRTWASHPARFNKAERQALSVLGLGDDIDRHKLRQTYSTRARLCNSCLHEAYFHHLLRNVTLGWWGTISFFATIYYLLANTLVDLGAECAKLWLGHKAPLRRARIRGLVRVARFQVSRLKGRANVS